MQLKWEIHNIYKYAIHKKYIYSKMQLLETMCQVDLLENGLYEVWICVFVFAFDSAIDYFNKWKFGVIYIDSCQDAKPIIILFKTPVKPQ